jgi:dipeptidyl aminopeptidase/acylaminoacyl peptidase
MESHTLDLELLMRVPYVDPDLGFDITPLGTQIAFSWNRTGRWEIYILQLDQLSQPRQISGGNGAKFAPRWRPDGKQLAYVVDLDGGENYDIHIFDLSSGKEKNLTPQTPDAITPGFAWSPDGNEIAYCCDRDGRFDTYVINTESGISRKVFDHHYPDFSVEWSPDMKWLAVECEAAGQDYWTFIVPLDGNPEFPISLAGNPISAKDGSWSPDSTTLAFASNYTGQYEIGLYDIQNKTVHWITETDGEKEFPGWSKDGNKLTYILSYGPKTSLVVFELATGKEHVHLYEPGVIYKPTFSPKNDAIIFVFDNPRHPNDLWSLSLDSGDFTQLTQSLPESIKRNLFRMPTEVEYPSLDGVSVPALLYTPDQEDRLPPAVINVHGGPNWLTQITWDPMTQHMVSRGWVVLAPNYRGSTGYGREWQLASRFDLGGVDTEDVVAGADYLAREGIANPQKVGITGRSWGGYLTMTSLTQYPDRWAVGSASVPFLNWFTSHKNSREDLQHWDRENFGDPDENYELWYERSPFFFLDKVRAPVQLLCGANDVRCPATESMQAYEQLVNLGKDCDYVLYPDEGHSILKMENQLDAKSRRVSYLARYLEK